MKNKQHINSNKVAWEEVNEFHQNFKKKYKDRFKEDQFVSINDVLLQTMNDLNFIGKSILHVCCNDGEELISLKKLGAGKCVGLDVSSSAIKSAEELNNTLGFDCEFVADDVYNIEEHITSEFDFILITVGALVWLPDLNLLFEKLSQRMSKGSKLIIHEQHPFSWLIDDEMKLSEKDLYFEKGPYVERGELDYLGNVQYDGSANYTFNYTLMELINGQINNGLTIQSFTEFPYDISNLKQMMENEKVSYPLSYLCVSMK